jgi:DNA phosphorothioation-associated putative methyltransferase
MIISWNTVSGLLRDLPYGKRISSALYIHRDTAVVREDPIKYIIEHFVRSHDIGNEFNVIKFRMDAPRISFLQYPLFHDVPHPALQCSVAVDIESETIYRTSYLNNPNPPVLHRKELLLELGDDRRHSYANLTAAEEAAGLYRNPMTIGFQSNWMRLLDLAGLTHDGHTLVRLREPDPAFRDELTTVQRHKTALTRYHLSKPVRTVLEYGQLGPGELFFDYGCGLGSDVHALIELGFKAHGWDPVHAPQAEFIQSEVVNLGFVLNVIEDPHERKDTLLQAWHFTKKLLVVAAMIAKGGDFAAPRRFQDGVLTTRQTFQKYFGQKELQEYIETLLETTAIPVAVGVFYVFRDDTDRQTFLGRRARRSIDVADIVWQFKKVTDPVSVPKTLRARAPTKREVYRDLLEELWQTTMRLGREPGATEFGRFPEIVHAFGSARRALSAILDDANRKALSSAQESKKEDLLVYLATANLRKPVPQHHLPEDLKADFKALFGGYQSALRIGLALLKSAADPRTITLACEEAGIGWQDSDAFYLHSRLIERLPAVLRVYVACGEILFGSALQADIVKIHKMSGKLTFLVYDRFDELLIPRLLSRSKINLRSGSLEEFDHSQDNQLLLFKDRFLDPQHQHAREVRAIASTLRALGASDLQFLGPSFSELIQMAEANQVCLKTLLEGVHTS